MRPDLRQLETLVVVARCGKLQRAADELHLSPSALSMQLAALQARLGVTLLRRTGRGLRLTEAGEQLLPAAQALVEGAQRFARAADQARGGRQAPARRVAIGTVLDPRFIRLGEFLRALHAGPLPLHTDLRHGTSGWVLREVREGRLDFGFYLGTVGAVPVQRQLLCPVRYVVVAPRGWAESLRGRSWAALAQLPWIDTPPDSVHHRLLHPLLRSQGATMNAVARVDQEASMLDLVREGVGLSLAREAEALREAQESGLAVSREHTIDTELSVVARLTPAGPRGREDKDAEAAEAAVAALFAAAREVWPDTEGEGARGPSPTLSAPTGTPARGRASTSPRTSPRPRAPRESNPSGGSSR